MLGAELAVAKDAGSQEGRRREIANGPLKVAGAGQLNFRERGERLAHRVCGLFSCR